MNFVLHHFLARRDLGTALGAVGAMLPDVWRMADKRARPALAVVSSEAPRVAELLAGIAHHARADVAFHICPAFVAGEHAITRDLSAIGPAKLAIFGHVACEIALDGALLRREPAAFAALRADLAEASRDGALDAAAALHHAARGRDVPAGLGPRVVRVLGEIARGPWVEGYATAEGLAARLEGVRARFALPPLSTDHRSALVAGFARASQIADGALDDVLALDVLCAAG